MSAIASSAPSEAAVQPTKDMEKDLEAAGDDRSDERGGDVGNSDPPSANEDSKAWKTATQEIPKNNLYLVFTGLMLATFLAALDQTIVGSALPTISRELGGTAEGYSWVGSAYLLLATASSPFYGKISNIVGRKLVLYPSIIVFMAASALCGAAKSLTWLCVARGLQGIGGGGILQLTQIIVSDIVPLSRRGAFGGAIGATWGLAAVIGPLVGGVFTDHVTWRWCFYVNLPTGGIALALLFFTLNLNPPPPTTFKAFLSTFDFVGLLLIIGGVVCVLVGLTEGEQSWSSATTIALLVVGVCICVAAGIWESRTTRSPIIPTRLFKTRTTGIILVTCFIHSYSFMALSFYEPIYFQVLGASATLSGVKLMPFSIGSAVISMGGGWFISRVGRTKEIMTVSFMLCAIGYALVATLDETSSLAKQMVYLSIAAVGVGPLFQSPYIAIAACLPINEVATATSAIGLVRSLGGTSGISISGAMYASVLKSNLRGVGGYSLASDSTAAGDVRGLVDIQPLDLRFTVLHAYTRAINSPWIVAAPMLFVAFVLSFFMKHYSLQRASVTVDSKGKRTLTDETAVEEDANSVVGEKVVEKA